MSRRASAPVVLLAALAGYVAGVLLPPTAGAPRRGEKGHDGGRSGPGLPEQALAEEDAASSANRQPYDREGRAHPVLSGTPPTREVGSAEGTTEFRPATTRAPQPSALAPASLTLAVNQADGTGAEGLVYATQSPAQPSAWTTACERNLEAGRAYLSLPQPGRYDVLIVCRSPLGYVLREGLEVGLAPTHVDLHLPAPQPIHLRLGNDLPVLPSSESHSVDLWLTARDPLLPSDVLFAASTKVRWRIDTRGEIGAGPLLLPGCHFHARVGLASATAEAGDSPWMADPPYVQAGDTLGLRAAALGRLEVSVRLADPSAWGDWSVEWSALVKRSEEQGEAQGQAQGPHPRRDGELHPGAQRVLEVPHWATAVRAGRYELVVECALARTWRGDFAIREGETVRMDVELEVDRNDTMSPASPLTVRARLSPDASPPRDAIQLHAAVAGKGPLRGSSMSADFNEVAPHDEISVPASWRRAAWLCAASEHTVSAWITPPAEGAVEFTLKPGGHVALMPRTARGAVEPTSFLAHLRRADGRPLIRHGVVEMEIEEPDAGYVLGPFEEGAVRFVAEVRGGGRQEHVVHVRAGETTILWID